MEGHTKRSYLRTAHDRTAASQKAPRVLKTELVTNFFWHNFKLPHSLFWHHFLLHQLCDGVKSACFPMKSSSACYHKCQCVLTVAAGVCSGEEVNDQQATAVTTVQMDDSNPETVDLVNHESTVPSGGGTAGWRDRGKEVQWCWTITWGLSVCGGVGVVGLNRKWMSEWFRGRGVSSVHQPMWVLTALIIMLLVCRQQSHTMPAPSNLHLKDYSTQSKIFWSIKYAAWRSERWLWNVVACSLALGVSCHCDIVSY